MGELRTVAWHEYDPDDLNMSCFSKRGDLKCKRISSWKMKTCF